VRCWPPAGAADAAGVEEPKADTEPKAGVPKPPPARETRGQFADESREREREWSMLEQVSVPAEPLRGLGAPKAGWPKAGAPKAGAALEAAPNGDEVAAAGVPNAEVLPNVGVERDEDASVGRLDVAPKRLMPPGQGRAQVSIGRVRNVKCKERSTRGRS
jgi:hypothetical protein